MFNIICQSHAMMHWKISCICFFIWNLKLRSQWICFSNYMFVSLTLYHFVFCLISYFEWNTCMFILFWYWIFPCNKYSIIWFIILKTSICHAHACICEMGMIAFTQTGPNDCGFDFLGFQSYSVLIFLLIRIWNLPKYSGDNGTFVNDSFKASFFNFIQASRCC